MEAAALVRRFRLAGVGSSGPGIRRRKSSAVKMDGKVWEGHVCVVHIAVSIGERAG